MKDYLFEYGLILAAGEGQRMRPLSLRLPKALLPEPSNSLLSRQMYFLSGYCEKVFVTKGYLASTIDTWAIRFGAHATLDTTGHGNAYFLNTLISMGIKSSVVVITCDNLMRINMHSLCLELKEVPNKHMLVGVDAQLGSQGDRVKDNHGMVESIGRKVVSSKLASGLQIIDMNVIANRQYEDFYDFWEVAISEDKLRIAKTQPELWEAFDTPESLKKLTGFPI